MMFPFFARHTFGATYRIDEVQVAKMNTMYSDLASQLSWIIEMSYAMWVMRTVLKEFCMCDF